MIYTEFVIRIFLSMLLGFLIGLERQLTGHPAGIRINVLICIGTSFFTLFPMLYGSDQVFRVGSSIISGVGFLCSGVIFKDSGTVRGMNTAATLWCTAAIGILASTGMYAIAVARLPADAEQWEQPVIVSDDPTRSEQNPSLFQNPNGDIWLMYTAQAAKKPDDNSDDSLQGTAEIRRKISRDGGRTWGPTEAVFTRPGSFCRQKIQVLSNGRWIFNNFICALDGTRLGSDVTVIQISDDQGKTWRGVEIPESRGRVHGNVIELEPGKLVCLLRSRAADHIYRSESNDNGETWSVPVPTPLRNNNASISAIKLQSGALAIIYNDVSFNEDGSRTVWPDQRCPVAMAISEDGGKTWPWRRIVEHGEGFIGPWNDVNNRRYEYPVMMQSKDGKIHAAYAWGRRVRIKYVCVDEAWIRGAKVCKGAEDNPEMPCNR